MSSLYTINMRQLMHVTNKCTINMSTSVWDIVGQTWKEETMDQRMATEKCVQQTSNFLMSCS